MAVDYIWTGQMRPPAAPADELVTATFTVYLPDDPGPVEIVDAWTAASQFAFNEGSGYFLFQAYIDSAEGEAGSITLSQQPSQLRLYVPGFTSLTFALVAQWATVFVPYHGPTMVMGVSFQHQIPL